MRSILLEIELKIELDLRQQKVSWEVSDTHCAWYTFDDKLRAGRGEKRLDQFDFLIEVKNVFLKFYYL